MPRMTKSLNGSDRISKKAFVYFCRQVGIDPQRFLDDCYRTETAVDVELTYPTIVISLDQNPIATLSCKNGTDHVGGFVPRSFEDKDSVLDYIDKKKLNYSQESHPREKYAPQIPKTTPDDSAREVIESFLEYHSKFGGDCLLPSPLCNDSFPSTFNASGFHEQIINLHRGGRSFPADGRKLYGVDACARHVDVNSDDEMHKIYFHMAIYAESIRRGKDHRGDFTNPAEDQQFFDFQEKVTGQFFDYITSEGLDMDNIYITFFGGGTVGGGKKDGISSRDDLLGATYDFSRDDGGVAAALKYVDRSRLTPVHSIENIDINSVTGSLVGPRMEVSYGNFEIATVVFDYYEVTEEGKLNPINYLGGYAIGIERLLAAKTGGDLYNRGVVAKGEKILSHVLENEDGCLPVVKAPLMKPRVRQLLSTTEALLHICTVPEGDVLGTRRRTYMNQMRKAVLKSAESLGLIQPSPFGFEKRGLTEFVVAYSDIIEESLPEEYNKTNPGGVLEVLGIE